MSVVINPGSGPVRGATEELASKAIEKFIQDLGVDGVTAEREPEHDYDKEYRDGRFCFLLKKSGDSVEVQVPGLEVDRVRYMEKESQNIWHYPRLYVNGSSWVWSFALHAVVRELCGEE